MNKYKFLTGTNKFDRSLEAITKHFRVEKKVLCREIATLMHNVDAAKAIPGFNKIRKLKVGIPGQLSKRKGLRFLCHVNPERRSILPLDLYYKGEIEDLPRKDLAALNEELRDLLASDSPREMECFKEENL